LLLALGMIFDLLLAAIDLLGAVHLHALRFLLEGRLELVEDLAALVAVAARGQSHHHREELHHGRTVRRAPTSAIDDRRSTDLFRTKLAVRGVYQRDEDARRGSAAGIRMRARPALRAPRGSPAAARGSGP